MRVVAVTGSFGSGKSTVLKFVSSRKVPVLDLDSVVASLYRLKPVQRKLLKQFGSFSKKQVSSLAFSSPKKRKRLESILWPRAWKGLRKRLASLRKQRKPVCFVEVPLLFEASWQNRFDAIVFVRCPKAKCLERLAKKGFSKKEALLRLKAQLSPEKKIKRCQYVIDNSGSLAKTRRRVRRFLKELEQNV